MIKPIKGTAAVANVVSTADGEKVPFVIFVGDTGEAYAASLLLIAKFSPDGKVDVNAQPGMGGNAIQAIVNAMVELRNTAPGRIVLA